MEKSMRIQASFASVLFFLEILFLKNPIFHTLYILYNEYKLLLLLLFTPREFFTPVLCDGLSLEFEWQQVNSSLQDSSQYYGRS